MLRFTTKISNKIRMSIATLLAITSYATVSTGYATDVSLNDLGAAGQTLQKIISFIFLISKVGGFAMAVFGIVQLVKYIQNHETAAPDALPKALGLLIGGVIMFFVKDILKAIGVSF